HNLGDYFAAICTIETALHQDQHQIFYPRIDKLLDVYCTNGTTKALFVFRSPGLKYDYKDTKLQKEIVSKIYADSEWEEVPNILKAMQESSDFYFDEVIQIRMDKWFKDRTIVIGDAAFCPCLASGQGTSMALVGAYVLGGELLLA